VGVRVDKRNVFVKLYSSGEDTITIIDSTLREYKIKLKIDIQKQNNLSFNDNKRTYLKPILSGSYLSGKKQSVLKTSAIGVVNLGIDERSSFSTSLIASRSSQQRKTMFQMWGLSLNSYGFNINYSGLTLQQAKVRQKRKALTVGYSKNFKKYSLFSSYSKMGEVSSYRIRLTSNFDKIRTNFMSSKSSNSTQNLSLRTAYLFSKGSGQIYSSFKTIDYNLRDLGLGVTNLRLANNRVNLQSKLNYTKTSDGFKSRFTISPYYLLPKGGKLTSSFNVSDSSHGYTIGGYKTFSQSPFVRGVGASYSNQITNDQSIKTIKMSINGTSERASIYKQIDHTGNATYGVSAYKTFKNKYFSGRGGLSIGPSGYSVNAKISADNLSVTASKNKRSLSLNASTRIKQCRLGVSVRSNNTNNDTTLGFNAYFMGKPYNTDSLSAFFRKRNTTEVNLYTDINLNHKLDIGEPAVPECEAFLFQKKDSELPERTKKSNNSGQIEFSNLYSGEPTTLYLNKCETEDLALAYAQKTYKTNPSSIDVPFYKKTPHYFLSNFKEAKNSINVNCEYSGGQQCILNNGQCKIEKATAEKCHYQLSPNQNYTSFSSSGDFKDSKETRIDLTEITKDEKVETYQLSGAKNCSGQIRGLTSEGWVNLIIDDFGFIESERKVKKIKTNNCVCLKPQMVLFDQNKFLCRRKK